MDIFRESNPSRDGVCIHLVFATQLLLPQACQIGCMCIAWFQCQWPFKPYHLPCPLEPYHGQGL